MLLNTDLNSKRVGGYETTIKSIEKSLEILDDRYKKKLISDREYIEKSQKLRNDLAKYKRMVERDF